MDSGGTSTILCSCDNRRLALRSLVICYAPGDEAPVGRLAEYLRANLSVEITFDTGLPLTDAVERAVSAPFALVLFSTASVPQVWTRSEWERAFLQASGDMGCNLAFGLLDACRFPEVLRRERFFDFTADFIGASRLVKQWLLRPEAAPQVVSGLPRCSWENSWERR